MYSSAGKSSALDTIREFEQVRGFFLQAFSGQPAKAAPVRLVAFALAKEYEPYRPNEFAAAYYQDSPDGDYIVMSHAGADTFPIAVHEYVHLLVRHSGLTLPPWLNEGLAELYSTLKPYGGKILIGDLITARYQALLNEKWVPLEAILAADRDSPYYNEKDKAGSLYNEGWALTHMLCLRAEYRPKFGQLLRTISDGKSSAAALAELYGKTVPQIEADLHAYLRGSSFQGLLVAAKLDKVSGEIPVENMADFDTGLMLSDLMSRHGKESDRQAALQRLVAQDPKRPEPYRSLGYLAWAAGQNQEAEDQFAKAFERGDHGPKLLWDYGRLLESTNAEQAIPVLSELLSLDTERLDVRLELAEAQLHTGNATAALATLAALHKITPADSARYFRIAVYAHLMNGDAKDAELTARHFLDVAETDEDRAAAERLLRAATPRSEKPATTQAAGDTGKPTLRHTTPGLAAPQPVRLPGRSAAGQFVDLQCSGNQARMVVETTEGRKVFLIEDPAKVIITGESDWQVDMTCGPQKKRAKVEVGYGPPGVNQTGLDGIVRSLAFQ